jgi:hypothetical protein
MITDRHGSGLELPPYEIPEEFIQTGPEIEEKRWKAANIDLLLARSMTFPGAFKFEDEKLQKFKTEL